MAQPQHLVGVDAVVDRERRRLGLVEHLERASAATSTSPVGRSGVDRALGPVRAPRPRPADVLAAHAVHVGAGDRVGVDDHLHDARRRRAGRGTPRRRGRGGCRPSRTRTTSRPMSVRRRSPARSVRIIGRSSSALASFLQPARDQLARGTSTCSPERRSFTATAPRCGLVASEHHAERARPTGRPTFHCAFTDRPPYARSARSPSSRSSATSSVTSRRRRAEPVDHEHVDRGRGRRERRPRRRRR